eukprot:COSAG05_NODE_6987_length_870_cov_1.540856_1_plen_39_part_01
MRAYNTRVCGLSCLFCVVHRIQAIGRTDGQTEGEKKEKA